MVKIEINEDETKLNLVFSGENFYDNIDYAKHLGISYNPSRKVWEGRLSLYYDYVEEFSLHDTVEVDVYTKQTVDNYLENMQELKTPKVRSDVIYYVPGLMRLGPLPTKEGYDAARL